MFGDYSTKPTEHWKPIRKLKTHNCAARTQGARRRPRGLGPGLELVLGAEQTLVCSLGSMWRGRRGGVAERWRGGWVARRR